MTFLHLHLRVPHLRPGGLTNFYSADFYSAFYSTVFYSAVTFLYLDLKVPTTSDLRVFTDFYSADLYSDFYSTNFYSTFYSDGSYSTFYSTVTVLHLHEGSPPIFILL